MLLLPKAVVYLDFEIQHLEWLKILSDHLKRHLSFNENIFLIFFKKNHQKTSNKLERAENCPVMWTHDCHSRSAPRSGDKSQGLSVF